MEGFDLSARMITAAEFGALLQQLVDHPVWEKLPDAVGQLGVGV